MSAAVQQKPQLLVKVSVVKGPHAGQVFQLNKPEISIGRGPENDIVLINDPQVSRLHARLVLVDRDFEITNLSRKNAVLVNGEKIDKWKLINNETFIVGDSEFKIEYHFGQAVASVPAKKIAEVVALKRPTPQPVTQVTQPRAQNTNAVAPRTTNTVAGQNRPGHGPSPVAFSRPQVSNPYGAPPAVKKQSLLQNPRARFYAIALLLLGGLLYFVLAPEKATSKKETSILKYEDEISIKLNSTPEKEVLQKRKELKDAKDSPQRQRAEENFIKGMRDYQLGNYARAIDFYQVVINLAPDHALARRHLYLAKIRFDELVQAKLMLGDSYYKKHNFKMCESLYRQVIDMLGDKKSNDPQYNVKLKLADSKAKECELAAEGIR